MTDLHYASLGAVCARIKSGELSARSVTEQILARIGNLEAELHAYAMVLEDSALERADELDRLRRDGAPLGALHGVPVAVKDLLFTRGLPTASGTLVMADFVPEVDATVVSRLKAAGAVIIGKTQLTEGAYGVHHPEITAPLNPWQHDRWPGVSSSGSAVAVSAGLCFGAVGSDTGGSIRFPSASCGVVGLKPTYGRVSRYGAFPLAESLDHIGPMTRSVGDAARMLQVMAGSDPQDSSTSSEPVPNYAAEVNESIRDLRIGIDWRYVERGVEQPVVDGVRTAVEILRGQGGVVREVEIPGDYRQLVDRWGVTCALECARAHRSLYPEQKARYGPVLAELIEFGLKVTTADYDALEVVRVRFQRDLDALFGEVDLLVAPSMPYLPPPVEGVLDLSADSDRANGLTFTAPFDYSGHPTLSVPAGLAGNGLPLSIQLIGPRLGEGVLIRAGSAYERELGFSGHPVP